MCHRQKQSIVFFPSPHIPIRLHQSIDSLMSDWIPSEIGGESWRGGEKRAAQFSQWLKQTQIALITSRTLWRGPEGQLWERGWRVTSRHRNSSETSHICWWSGALLLVENKSFFQKYNVEFDHFPTGEEWCWLSIMREYQLSSYKWFSAGFAADFILDIEWQTNTVLLLLVI